jgi:hypothetical protein
MASKEELFKKRKALVFLREQECGLPALIKIASATT